MLTTNDKICIGRCDLIEQEQYVQIWCFETCHETAGNG